MTNIQYEHGGIYEDNEVYLFDTYVDSIQKDVELVVNASFDLGCDFG